MKRKGIVAGILPLCLLLLLLVQSAAAQSTQSTTITTKVPESHVVKLELSGSGTVSASGQAYSESQEIRVERLKEETYRIEPAEGWETREVTYGKEGAQEEVLLTGGSYTAPAAYENGNVLTVTFVKGETEETETETEKQTETEKTTESQSKPAPGTPGKPGASGTTGTPAAKTGDSTNLAGLLAVLLISGVTVFIVAAKRVRHRRR